MANMIDYNKNLNIQEVKRIVKKIIQEEFNFYYVSKQELKFQNQFNMGDLAYWPSVKPVSKKDKFAKNRDFIKNLHHIDQIWEKLKFKCGDTLAVSDLRGKYKEKFSYSEFCLLYTSPSPRDRQKSRMPSSA